MEDGQYNGCRVTRTDRPETGQLSGFRPSFYFIPMGEKPVADEHRIIEPTKQGLRLIGVIMTEVR